MLDVVPAKVVVVVVVVGNLVVVVVALVGVVGAVVVGCVVVVGATVVVDGTVVVVDASVCSTGEVGVTDVDGPNVPVPSGVVEIVTEGRPGTLVGGTSGPAVGVMTAGTSSVADAGTV